MQPMANSRNASRRASLTAALGLLTGRWVLPLLDELAVGPKRHGELKDAIGLGREGGGHSLDFYTESRIVHVALEDPKVPRFGTEGT